MTFSQGKQASSWNTTPTPSGTPPAMGLSSNSTVPSLAGVRPAITSSNVDLPHPDGPDDGKELAFDQIEIDWPESVQVAAALWAGKILVTPLSRTWARADAASRRPSPSIASRACITSVL